LYLDGSLLSLCAKSQRSPHFSEPCGVGGIDGASICESTFSREFVMDDGFRVGPVMCEFVQDRRTGKL
jgi:hypothetical protein